MLAELLIAGQVWAKIRQLGPVGEVLLGLADASVVPTPGSLDILLILLVASERQHWWIYVIAATIGSTLGAYVTYGIGEKGGKEGLEKRIPEKKLRKVYRWSEKYGVGAVAVPALLPPPFPLSPFLLAAGVLKVPKTKFLSAYAAGRLVRYSIVAWLGMRYGKGLIHWIQQYSKPIIWVLIGLAVLGGIAAGIYIYQRKRKGLPALHSAEKRAA
ncbi:MAG: VTT domain-containing protein [Acidobacteria bacterium]|nr:VTT domain-containing protein [Acidobacteriota bacterium]MBV9145404.1 VTT domain-containing protein [Acidobacteriota bacterium]MBV9435962.1 VTT domain-containing protein [Acidobacteriota bacterium]